MSTSVPPAAHTNDTNDAILREQIAYYRARASEYDEWFLRQGRYDRGVEENARWFAEAAQVADLLEASLRATQAADPPAGLNILELASGTGIWTERLLRHAARLTIVDSSPEMLALTQERIARVQAAQPELGTRQLNAIQADLFSWRPAARYDVIFFGFWLSHVPPDRFDAFWNRLRDGLAPGGRACFVDSLYTEQSTARDHQLEGADATTLTRRLNDGQEYRIVKVFYLPVELTARLASLGWRASIQTTPTYFYYGEAQETEQTA